MKVQVKSNGVDGEVTLEDGTPLKGVTHAHVFIGAGQPTVVTLGFTLPLVDVVGHATVSEEHLTELAKAHGFILKRRVDA